MMMYKIRYADVNDAKVLGEIHSKSWKIAYKNIVPDSVLNNISAEKRQKYFEKALSEKLEEDALIFVDDKAVGLMSIGKCRDEDQDSTCGEIWGIYLLPEYWHKGIGTYFIQWGLNELKNRNFQKATLWVLEENIHARKFYKKMGFRHDGTVKEILIGKKLNEYRYEIIIS
jgi:ribosomal protein S18 acetylase RimI-like enzyme